MSIEKSVIETLWKNEVKARHRWGRYPELVDDHLEKLQPLWDRINSPDENLKALVEQLTSLEVCNWKYKESAFELICAIGELTPLSHEIGHMSSVDHERKRHIWAYYLSLQYWLSKAQITDYIEQRESVSSALTLFQDGVDIQKGVDAKLGKPTELKILLVSRLSLELLNKLHGYFADDSISGKINGNTKEFIDKELSNHDFDERFVKAIDRGDLQLCHHKFFRRLDIIISSIGANRWRDKIPQVKDDGLKLATTIDEITKPLCSWLKGEESNNFTVILGDMDAKKTFLISLFVSLLDSQKKRAIDIANYHLKA